VSATADSAGDPVVSVQMPARDAERFLREAVASVRAQSFTRWELLIVDDGSRDATLSIANELAGLDSRIRVLPNERNLGIVASRNRALSATHPACRYVAIFDADDVCMPDRLERQVAYLDAHPRCALVGGQTAIIDEDGREVGLRRYPTLDRELRRVITRYNPFAQPTVLLRRSALDVVGGYDPRYPRVQDYDLWLRIAERFEVANLDVVTLQYRISATQGKTKHLKDSLRYTLAIQRKWLLHPAFFRPFNALYWTAEHALLALPDPLVLALFKAVTYRGKARS
jgi:glycosyltransferase involved in cell wall biosynthesis